jgi:hypothetical protein
VWVIEGRQRNRREAPGANVMDGPRWRARVKLGVSGLRGGTSFDARCKYYPDSQKQQSGIILLISGYNMARWCN